MCWLTLLRCLFVPFLTAGTHRAPTCHFLGCHCLPIAHDDDVDATGTGGLLATAAPGAVHLAVIAGTVPVPYAIPWVGISLSIAHNDNIDATGTSGSLTTTTPGAVHLTVVIGTVTVSHTIP